jgi:hypothetical protein
MSPEARARRVIPNIGPQGIAGRRRRGGAALVSGGVAAVALALAGGPWLALATFPFFWAGALLLLQAHEKT